MAFTKSADGVARKGKTEGKNYGDRGPTVPTQHGGKGCKGVSTDEMLSLGRNLARVANQKRG